MYNPILPSATLYVAQEMDERIRAARARRLARDLRRQARRERRAARPTSPPTRRPRGAFTAVHLPRRRAV